jgi:hypothetical protein
MKKLLHYFAFGIIIVGCNKSVDVNNQEINIPVSLSTIPSDTLHQVVINIDSTYIEIIGTGSHFSWRTVTVYDTTQRNIFIDSFQLSAKEIDVKLFKTVLAKYPLDTAITNLSDTVPVHNITLAEAMIFCNELSKRNGYEPYFNYTEDINSTNEIQVSCVFCVDTQADGYRLATRIELNNAYKNNFITKNNDLYTLDTYPDTSIQGSRGSGCGDHTIWGENVNCISGPENYWPNACLRIVKNIPHTVQ